MARSKTAPRLHLLSVKQVQSAGDGDHGDGGGLVLRVRGASSAWVFRYTAPSGRRREMGLGIALRGSPAQAGDTVTAARRQAHEAREQLQQAIDPIEARDRRRTVAQMAEKVKKESKARTHWTLGRCARDYHERVIEPSRTTKHAAQWIASLEHHIPPTLWDKPIEAVQPPELLKALSGVRSLDDKEARIPETLQRLRQRLDAVFEDAIFHNRCTSNAAAAIRRKMYESMPKKQAGNFNALPYREAPGFMVRLRQEGGTAARSLELALLTAARTAEVLFAEWPEFDLDAAVWVVPGAKMKTGEDHTVYLSPRAVELLREVKALQLHRTIVFPSPMLPDKPMSNMAMLTVLRRMGVSDRTTVHGLCRATFSTWANDTDAAKPDVIEACLAHQEADRVRAAYNRAEFAAQRRRLLEDWANYLASTAQVIPFPRSA